MLDCFGTSYVRVYNANKVSTLFPLNNLKLDFKTRFID